MLRAIQQAACSSSSKKAYRIKQLQIKQQKKTSRTKTKPKQTK
jgi:hypothetical protein